MPTARAYFNALQNVSPLVQMFTPTCLQLDTDRIRASSIRQTLESHIQRNMCTVHVVFTCTLVLARKCFRTLPSPQTQMSDLHFMHVLLLSKVNHPSERLALNLKKLRSGEPKPDAKLVCTFSGTRSRMGA